MLKFVSDYMEGAHPKILEKLVETNLVKTEGYGLDKYSFKAKEKIKKACNLPDSDVYFFVGGTQTNATVISAFLKSYEGVIAAETGHIFTHESGAIELGGHKVLSLKHQDGKISANDVDKYIDIFNKDLNNAHVVKPGMVYISQPTEYGTLYTKQELIDLSTVCKNRNIPLFLDGARLGYGLMAENNDVSLEDIGNLTDMFYIGGTKVGAMFGEAFVVKEPFKVDGFMSIMKQRGALLSKGRMLGIQFDTLFTDDLYLKISKHAVDMAMKLKKALIKKGYEIYIDSPTNQQFIVVNNRKMNELAKTVDFGFMETLNDNQSVIRFCTSWATLEEDVNKLIELL